MGNEGHSYKQFWSGVKQAVWKKVVVITFVCILAGALTALCAWKFFGVVDRLDLAAFFGMGFAVAEAVFVSFAALRRRKKLGR